MSIENIGKGEVKSKGVRDIFHGGGAGVTVF